MERAKRAFEGTEPYEADCDDFENIFYNNMLESRERAEKR